MSTPMDVDPPAAATKASGTGKEKPRFEVKKVSIHLLFINAISGTRSLYGHGVAIVSLFFDSLVDIVVDNCAICRNHIMDLCKSWGVAYTNQKA